MRPVMRSVSLMYLLVCATSAPLVGCRGSNQEIPQEVLPAEVEPEARPDAAPTAPTKSSQDEVSPTGTVELGLEGSTPAEGVTIERAAPVVETADGADMGSNDVADLGQASAATPAAANGATLQQCRESFLACKLKESCIRKKVPDCVPMLDVLQEEALAAQPPPVDP